MWLVVALLGCGEPEKVLEEEITFEAPEVDWEVAEEVEPVEEVKEEEPPPAPAPTKAAPRPRAPVGGMIDGMNTTEGSRIIQGYSPQLQYCYEKELKVNGRLQGEVRLAWTVTNGVVSSPSVVKNQTGSKGLGDCLVKKVKRWKFPKDMSATISWPFNFKPKKSLR